MAKRSRKSDTNRTLVTILTFIFLVLAVLIAEQVGVDVLNEEETNGPGTDDSGSSSEPVVDTYVGEGGWYNLYFTTPLNTNDESLHTGSPLEDAIILSINNAQSTIDGALFELNLERVTQALIEARNRGVRVRLVLDDDHAVFEEDDTGEMVKSETTRTFENAGWVIYCEDETPSTYDIRCDDRGAFMHNKFLIIDSADVWTGSTNFTHNGVYNNNNNAILIHSSRLAANYQSEFDEMFHDGIFTRSADQNNLPDRQLTINGVVVETYFSPEDGVIIENRVVELINQADTSVLLLTNLVTLDSIGEALVQRHSDGIAIQGIFESRGSTEDYSEMVRLGCVDIPVKKDGNPSTFHHKVIIIDNEIVISGSYNFSDSARDDNSENVLIFHSPEIAQQFTNEFNRHFNDPRAETPTRAELGCG